MEEAIALIDKIIEEHQTIAQRLRTLVEVANDAEAIAGLEKAKDTFMPGRPEQKGGLPKLRDSLEVTIQGLQAHFNREETGLLVAFEKHADAKLVSALQSLLLEHADIRQRFNQQRTHITELMIGGLSRNVWEASAHDLRAHITHTRKLVETHAEIERELLTALRKELTGVKKK